MTNDELLVFIGPAIILFILSLINLFLVWPKKRQIKNINNNMSYCVISDHILSLIALNMIIYAFCNLAEIILDYHVTVNCKSNSDSSDSCYQAKKLWSGIIRYQQLVGIVTRVITIT